jgi:hypothetical protein
MKKLILIGTVSILEAFFIIFLLTQERFKPKPELKALVNESENTVQIYTDKRDIGSIRFYDDYGICDINIQDSNVKIFVGATEYGLKFFEIRDDKIKYRNTTQFDSFDGELMERKESFQDELWIYKLFEIDEENKKFDSATNSWQYYVLEEQ